MRRKAWISGSGNDGAEGRLILMDQTSQSSNFLDAHARVREARIKFLRYAELRYRQFLSDPEQKPHAAACIHFNNWHDCRERFGYRGLETLNQQIEERVLPELDRSDVCARFNDSALVLVMCADRGRQDIETWAKRVLRILGDNPLKLDKHDVGATFSFGLCWFDRRVRGAEEALCDAIEVAEIQAEYNENRLRIFQPARILDDSLGDEEQVLGLVMGALETNRMRIVFQPLLSADSNRLRYYQAWARVISEAGKELRAREFLGALRHSGVLARLNRWTLRRAIHFLAADQHSDNNIRLFVNVSTDTFDARTVHWLEQMLEEHPACRNTLIVEFDEFDFSNRGTEALDLSGKLERMGIHPGVAGIGAANLTRAQAYLTDVEFIRMAPGFADEIERNPTLTHRFINLIKAAHGHDVRVIMPEMNSERQIVEVWKRGVDLVQGDYIEHPRILLHSALAE